MIDVTILLSGRRYVVLISPFVHITATSRDSAYHTAWAVADAINQNSHNQARIIDRTQNPPVILK